MWRNPLLIAGGEFFSLEITSDTLIGNLWTYLGSPASPTAVSILVDGADIGDVRITNSFAAGSTFTFKCVNGGRILGLGGAGGVGANPQSPYGAIGGLGTKGGDAINSVFDVSVDVDDGYLLGGGGGGGGGGSWWLDIGFSVGPGIIRFAGGGGGGGQGFNGGAGGAGGTGASYNPAQAGTAGTRTASGSGGAGSTTTLFGGDGGKLGSGGQTGGAGPQNQVTGQRFRNIGGVGGNAGAAFKGSTGKTLSFSGVKSETTLRSEGRILGETGGVTPLYVAASRYDDTNKSSNPLSSTHGFTFQADGDLLFLAESNSLKTNLWVNGTLAAIGANYEVRGVERTTTVDRVGTWDASAAADNTWVSLSSNRTWSFTTTAARTTAQLFEIRRSDVPGNPDDEIIASFWLMADERNV